MQETTFNGTSILLPAEKPMQEVSQFSVSGTGSFMRMHSDVVAANYYTETSPAAAPFRAKGRPSTNPIGQYEPIGDALLPLLAMAAVYFVITRVRNHKTSK